jgi:hypothetical protein
VLCQPRFKPTAASKKKGTLSPGDLSVHCLCTRLHPHLLGTAVALASKVTIDIVLLMFNFIEEGRGHVRFEGNLREGVEGAGGLA